MATKTTLHHLVSSVTGETAPLHWLGTDEYGRRVAQNPGDEWAPVDAHGRECVVSYDGDGNFVELTPTYVATTE